MEREFGRLFQKKTRAAPSKRTAALVLFHQNSRDCLENSVYLLDPNTVMIYIISADPGIR